LNEAARSCSNTNASKREREWEVAKAVKLPIHKWQCMSCGCKFKFHKTAKKHKCPNSKVACVLREAASRQALQATPVAKVDKPPALLTSYTPAKELTAWSKHPGPSNIDPRPAVTKELLEKKCQTGGLFIENVETGSCWQIQKEELEYFLRTECWKLFG
jgi:hypothetical protein